MEKRRQFLKTTAQILGGMGMLFSPLFKVVRTVYGQNQKIILPQDTSRQSLINKDPDSLDTRNLAPTPLKDFDTMGLSDHVVDLNAWRLMVTGRVQNPLQLTYSQIHDLPAVERSILLICPGFFANQGRWKGIDMGKLLEKGRRATDATHVSFSGPQGRYEKVERFPIEDILSNKVFLAYGVNGKTLPQKHGFPLRAVAEGYYGSDWVKYVYKVEVI